MCIHYHTFKCMAMSSIIHSSVNNEVVTLTVFIFLFFYWKFCILGKHISQVHKVFQNMEDIKGDKKERVQLL